MAEIVDGNSQNIVEGHSPRTRSHFNLSAPFGNTLRFAEYSPHLVIDAVPDDKKITYRSGHDIRTYSFKAPLMQDIQINKDYFLVPREAILPRNWAKIYVNPKHGDDIVASQVNSVHTTFYRSFDTILSNILNLRSQTGFDFRGYVYYWLIGELVLSKGCLLSTLGCHPSKSLWNCTKDGDGNTVRARSFDVTFDEAMSICQQYIASVKIGSTTYFISSTTDISLRFVTWRVALELIRMNLSAGFTLTFNDATLFKSRMDNIMSGIFSAYDLENEVDLAFPVAYNMICAHYYSNDNIDFVYSAELYRQACQALFVVFDGSVPQFTYNGVSYQYDIFSAFCFEKACNYGAGIDWTDMGSESTYFPAFLGFIQNILSYKRSLRYQDYFTGSRSQPLAVGGVNINVQSGSPNYVSAIDVTRNIQRQRMLNAVLRTGQQLEEYLKGIFHASPAPDYHNPFFISHTSDKVYAVEVENTADAQQNDANSVTSVLKSNADRYAFEVDVDRPSIIMGITSFDVTRLYGDGTDRMFTHVDRFDMFNPFMQFVGDQHIDRSELETGLSGVFSYTTRHMEYKQKYPTCAGGFCEFLPGFAFIAPRLSDEMNQQISPAFIRARNYELDPFYVSLTGYSLASYFHFIVKNWNEVSASRPMSYNPNIL